ncbi:cyclic AMP-dependent transcription factor ATF-4-like [Polyodon spathula]|uniref:cyclic AMP-dependent transcription factor ATF-4-like n=1 Tax=Polyodon spathula TaxID=7913 RepID=UPI001B7DC285|nr:cyclic AMP-dependent transcription factor ATF-4-like [Polyodon spathula]
MTSSALTSDPLGGILDSLLWGSPLFPTAELEGGGAGGLFLSSSSDDDEEMFQSRLKEFGSPSSSPLSPPSSSLFSSSPSCSPLQCPLGKGSSVESIDWLLDPLAGDCAEDAFSGMDWMVQKIDLSELDLDSLMDPCDSGVPPSTPEDLLSSRGAVCDLDLGLEGYLASFPAEPPTDSSCIPEPLDLQNPALPEPAVAVETLWETVSLATGFAPAAGIGVQLELEPLLEREPLSSSSSPSALEDHPSFSLELGSEVDINTAQETQSEPGLLPWKQETQTPETRLQTQETEPGLLPWKQETQTMETEGYCSSDTDSGLGSPEHSPASSSEPRKALAEDSDQPSFTQELGSEIDIEAAAQEETRSEPGLQLWKREAQAMEIEGYCSSDTDSGLGSSCGSPIRTPPSSSEPRRATAKPYSRPSKEEELEVCAPLSGHVKSADKRKMKKMEQNKTAATRYRQKKRSELDRLRGEREALEEKNRALGEKAEAIAAEIRYLTELMREVREARDRRLQQGKGSG